MQQYAWVMEILGAIARWALTFVSAWLVGKGILTQQQGETFLNGATAALVLGVVSLAWTLYSKYKDRLKLMTSLSMPQLRTEQEVKKAISDGVSASSMTPSNEIPEAKTTPASSTIDPKNYVPILLMVLLPFSSLACGKTSKINTVPAVVEQSAETADAAVKAGAQKALGIIVASDRLMNTATKIEDLAFKEGAVPAGTQRRFDDLVLQYIRGSEAAVNYIKTGVHSWTELKAKLDPIIETVSSIQDLVNSSTGLKARLLSFVDALKEVALELVGRALCGAACAS